MVPSDYTAFFAASAGAGAALVGLLFVAISVAPHRTVKGSAPLERQAAAGNAFTALITAFFISLGALIPGGLGDAALVMTFLALVSTLNLGRRLFRHWSGWQSGLRRGFLVVISLVVYGYEFYLAARFTAGSQGVDDIAPMASFLLGIYGLGLVRAWELLGAQRYGIAGWLSLLHDVEDEADEPPGLVAAVPEASEVGLPPSTKTTPGR
ncbi:MAG TPA: hypothetical protein VFU32_15710 [Ktedonobacterales bacterium]|nr:hypothetical protein [Ktedonobacterales bacterium]